MKESIGIKDIESGDNQPETAGSEKPVKNPDNLTTETLGSVSESNFKKQTDKVQAENPADQPAELKKLEDKLGRLKGVPEYIKMTAEQAEAYKYAYLERYGRGETISEAERLENLKPFLKKEEIDKMLDEVSKPLSRVERIMKRLGRKVSPKYDTISNSLLKKVGARRAQEREVMIAAIGEESALVASGGEVKTPLIIGEKLREKLHGDKGFYHNFFDRFGNHYFRGPDGRMSACNTLGKYFNVGIQAKVIENTPYGLREDAKDRFLAEKSETFDASNMTAEDCDKIDPLPVPDAKKSYASAVLINLMGGASDTKIGWNREGAKNYFQRMDGTYYLFDLNGYVPVEGNIEEQLRRLGAFLDELSGEECEETLLYMAKTTVFMSTLQYEEYDESRVGRFSSAHMQFWYFSKFPGRFYKMLEKSSLKDEYKTPLMDLILKELGSFKQN